ncbi:MAG: glycosyltransferase family 4 protein [Muribaculaceae bacterium]|nr:glycosyltransferase family 4 protein [Muribaculaceae bacterium]
MQKKKKIIRATTVPTSLDTFCREQLRELNERYEVVAVSSPLPELEVVANREGVRTIAVKMERHISPWNDLKSLIKMIYVFAKERPWMVHSMTPKAGLVCMMAAWITRVPKRVHTFTGLLWPTATGIKRKILMTTDRILCACATHIIPEGNGVKRDLIEGGITRKPMRVLANGNVRGIDLVHYNRTPQVMEEAEKIRKEGVTTFIFIGRVVRDKGMHELVDAFVRLHKLHSNTRLILVGRVEPELDPLNIETQQVIDAHDAIEAVGNQKDVRPWLAASDVLVFPSYREGFPNVVIEAGALELPSIVSDINGCNEIIIPDENGVIIPSKDADALYEAMLEMHINEADRTRMASNARKSMVTRFDCHIVRRALYDFYDSLEESE